MPGIDEARMKRNSIRKQFGLIFAVLIIGFFVICTIDVALNNTSSTQMDLFFLRMDDFLADYSNTAGYSYRGSPYQNSTHGYQHHQYPPLAYLLSQFASCFSGNMRKHYNAQYFLKLYQEPLFIYSFILLYMFIAICGFELIKKNVKRSRDKWLISIAMMVSYPVLFTIERGNNAIIASILVMVYCFFYDHDSKAVRELALIALALAVALKLTPAVLAILLIYDKRYKDAVRITIYGALFTVLPFCFLDGGLAKELPLWYRNVRISAVRHSAFSGISISAVMANFLGGADAVDEIPALRTTLLIVNYVICAFFLLSAPLYRQKWEKILAVTMVSISISGQSLEYNLLYLIPFMVFFFNEEEYRVADGITLLFILLIMYTYQSDLWTWGLNYNIAILGLCVMLLAKGIHNICLWHPINRLRGVGA